MPSPYLYTCLSVRPTFALSRKKKRIPDRRLSARNNWSQCDFVIDIRSGRSIGLLTFKPCDWHFDSDTSGLNIPEDGKKIEFWALASPGFIQASGERWFAFLFTQFFVKMNTTLSRPSHFVAKMYTYTCQHLFFLLCLCTKFTGIMKQIIRFSGVLLMLTHFLNWLWHKVDHSLP